MHRTPRSRPWAARSAGLCEIRGTEPFFDLGHFHLHDGEMFPALLLQHLIEGYQEVVDVPSDYPNQIRRSAILLGLRQLSQWISPERARPIDDAGVSYRARRFTELLASADRSTTATAESLVEIAAQRPDVS